MALPRRRGFTLIELLIVIAVIGILAAVAAPRISRAIASRTAASAASVLAADVEAAFATAARIRKPIVYTCVELTRRCRANQQGTTTVVVDRTFDAENGMEVRSIKWAPDDDSRPVVIGPSGLATQGFTIVVAHGGSSRRIVASRAGVVRIVQ